MSLDNRIKSVYVYSPLGQVTDPEFTITGEGEMILDNVKCVTDVQHTLDKFALLEDDPIHWTSTLDARRGEIDAGRRSLVDGRLREAASTGVLVESFRGTNVENFLACI